MDSEEGILLFGSSKAVAQEEVVYVPCADRGLHAKGHVQSRKISKRLLRKVVVTAEQILHDASVKYPVTVRLR